MFCKKESYSFSRETARYSRPSVLLRYRTEIEKVILKHHCCNRATLLCYFGNFLTLTLCNIRPQHKALVQAMQKIKCYKIVMLRCKVDRFISSISIDWIVSHQPPRIPIVFDILAKYRYRYPWPSVLFDILSKSKNWYWNITAVN